MNNGMMIDASAIVAIMSCEPGFEGLQDRAERSTKAYSSAIAIHEASLAISRKRNVSVAVAEFDVRDFLSGLDATILPLDGETATAAIKAHARFGKGTGHPAQLNMGDCFAYALAKTKNMPLLFKGDDFGRTDIKRA